MDPIEFHRRMSGLLETLYGDSRQEALDDFTFAAAMLMSEVLDKLGYREGVELFRTLKPESHEVPC